MGNCLSADKKQRKNTAIIKDKQKLNALKDNQMSQEIKNSQYHQLRSAHNSFQQLQGNKCSIPQEQSAAPRLPNEKIEFQNMTGQLNLRGDSDKGQSINQIKNIDEKNENKQNMFSKTQQFGKILVEDNEGGYSNVQKKQYLSLPTKNINIFKSNPQQKAQRKKESELSQRHKLNLSENQNKSINVKNSKQIPNGMKKYDNTTINFKISTEKQESNNQIDVKAIQPFEQKQQFDRNGDEIKPKSQIGIKTNKSYVQNKKRVNSQGCDEGQNTGQVSLKQEIKKSNQINLADLKNQEIHCDEIIYQVPSDMETEKKNSKCSRATNNMDNQLKDYKCSLIINQESENQLNQTDNRVSRQSQKIKEQANKAGNPILRQNSEINHQQSYQDDSNQFDQEYEQVFKRKQKFSNYSADIPRDQQELSLIDIRKSEMKVKI